MNSFFILSYILLIILNSWLISCSYSVQTTTLWLSKNILEKENIPIKDTYKHSLNLIQSLITPKNQSVRHVVLPITILVLLINSYLIHWYFCLISVIAIYILTSIIIAVYHRKKLFDNITTINEALQQKQIIYENKGDREKAVFIIDMQIFVQKLLIYAKDNNLDLNKI